MDYDRVVAVGVRSILSFAPTILQVPPGVTLRKVDMATELQILAYHAQRGEAGGETGASSDPDTTYDDATHPGGQPA